MSAETLKLALTATLTDVNGNAYVSSSFLMQFLSQTKAVMREFTIPHGSTPVDLWDPTTWTGYPEAAFQAILVGIQDIGVALASASKVPVELEEEICNLAAAQGFVHTIPAGGFFIIPGNASYRSPAAQNDQWTTSTAGVINRLRARNKDLATDVKLTMFFIDNTAP